MITIIITILSLITNLILLRLLRNSKHQESECYKAFKDLLNKYYKILKNYKNV